MLLLICLQNYAIKKKKGVVKSFETMSFCVNYVC